MITLLALITSGCSSLTGSSGTATPTINPNAATLKPTAVPSVASQPTGVTTTATGTTISASVNQNVPLPMDAGGYLVKVQSNWYLAVDSTSQGSIASINSASGGTTSRIMQYSAQQDTFKISNAKAPYTVTITKLPLPNPVTPPQTFSGIGMQDSGPITLSKGTATFSIKCPNTAADPNGISMFAVDLKDGTTGDEIGKIAMNTGTDPNHPVLTDYNSQTTFDIPANGVYIVEVSMANPQASWQITVSE